MPLLSDCFIPGLEIMTCCIFSNSCFKVSNLTSISEDNLCELLELELNCFCNAIISLIRVCNSLRFSVNSLDESDCKNRCASASERR